MKKALIISYLILFFFILATCAKKVDDVIQVIPLDSTEQIDLVKAKQIIDTGCLVCHSATADEDNRLAPPLEAVKRRYLLVYPKIEEFTEAVVDFVSDPTEENAIMLGSIQKFNLMLPMEYSEEDIEAVATYIYQYELEKPDWFEAHYQEMHGDVEIGRKPRLSP